MNLSDQLLLHMAGYPVLMSHSSLQSLASVASKLLNNSSFNDVNVHTYIYAENQTNIMSIDIDNCKFGYDKLKMLTLTYSNRLP